MSGQDARRSRERKYLERNPPRVRLVAPAAWVEVCAQTDWLRMFMLLATERKQPSQTEVPHA